MTGLHVRDARRVKTWRVVLVAFVMVAAPAASDDLADLIPNLFDREIFLKPPGPGQFDHSTHFRDEGDRRANRVEPTEKAFEAMQRLQPVFDQFYDLALGGFTVAELDGLAAALEIMRANLATDPALLAPISLENKADPATELGPK